jgi:hypothetical protein
MWRKHGKNHFWRIDLVIASMLLANLCSAAWPQSETPVNGLLIYSDGTSEAASLLEIDKSETMKFAATSTRSIPANRIWRWGDDSAILRGPYLLLKDGSRLAAPSVTGDAKQLTFSVDEIHPELWDGRTLPLAELRAILWKTPLGQKGLRDCLDLQSAVAADTLHLDNGDALVGEYLAIVTNTDTQVEEVLFNVRGVESRIPLARCVLLEFAERSKEPTTSSGNAWTIAFRDGSRLKAHDLTVDANTATWQVAGGTRWELKADRFFKNCILIEPPRRGVTFLSDLQELSYRHLPLFGPATAFRPDRNALNDPLRRAGAYREKGVGMWSNSRLSYAVPQGATRFQAEVCIDDAAGKQGSAVFRVLAQMKDVKTAPLKDLYRSEILRGGEETKHVDLDLSGAANIILLVEAADQGETLDLADWLDARFVISSVAP